MIMNLKTTINAYPKLPSSVLEDYVTKAELEEKDYVTHSELYEELKNFVTDVADNSSSIIYGRQKGKWVPVIEIKNKENGILCWGMNSSDNLTSEQLYEFPRQFTLQSINEYLVENTPIKNGYFWFASTSPIRFVIANNGLEYNQPLQETAPVTINYNNQSLIFHCYRTQKLVALPGVSYKFKVNIGE